MAVAGTLVSMLAHTAAHQYGFEFWGIRTAKLREAMARQVSWGVTGITAGVARAVIALGLLPPYRLGVASDPAWMRRLRPPRRRGRVRVAPHRRARRRARRLREPLPVQRHRPHAAARGLRAARSARPAGLAGRPHRADPAGTGILVLPEHHPLQLAKRCATIDRLSGGRLFLGVGVGWMREEVAALGIDPDERGSRTDEAIDALRVIWQRGRADLRRPALPLRPGPQPPQAGPADDPDPRRRPQPGGRPPGRRTRRRLLPARPVR